MISSPEDNSTKSSNSFTDGDVGFLRFLNLGIGIEVEVEKSPRDEMAELPPGWSAKIDDSLRNMGVEFVTEFGYRLVDASWLLNGLQKYIQKWRKEQPEFFEFNERTSVHVHIDIRKLSPDDLKNLIILYTLFEDSLFELAGEHRKHGVFCVPLRYVAMSELNQYSLTKFIVGWEKYCAMNLKRLRDFGTVEFRHMEGTCDYDRLFTWICILGRLVDVARTINTEQLMAEVSRLKYSSHYDEFAGQVFGPLKNEINIDPRGFDRAVSDAKLFFHLRTTE